jgi:hypothetical protein
MRTEMVQVFSNEEETDKSPFSFLLSMTSGEMIWDIRAVFSVKNNNYASKDTSLTEVLSEEALKSIEVLVDETSQEFLGAYKPSDADQKDSAMKFVDKVKARVKGFLGDNSASDYLEI